MQRSGSFKLLYRFPATLLSCPILLLLVRILRIDHTRVSRCISNQTSNLEQYIQVLRTSNFWTWSHGSNCELANRRTNEVFRSTREHIKIFLNQRSTSKTVAKPNRHMVDALPPISSDKRIEHEYSSTQVDDVPNKEDKYLGFFPFTLLKHKVRLLSMLSNKRYWHVMDVS